MKLYTVLIAIFMAVLVSACSSNYKNAEAGTDHATKPLNDAPGSSVNVDKMDSGSSETSTIQGSPLQSGNPGVPDWDKEIIKTAELTLEIKDYKGYNSRVHKNVVSYGGYIAAEEQNESETRITNSITLKVPVNRFEDLVNYLSSGEVKLTEKKITSDDVTGEVIDTKSRIEAKKQIRARYIELLKQAKNMQEILQVQTEINAIQEGLESAGGRVNYLIHQSAYSTVHLTYYQYLKDSDATNSEPGFFSKFIESVKTGSSLVSGFVLGVATIWPLLVAVVLGWFLIRKRKLYSFKNTK